MGRTMKTGAKVAIGGLVAGGLLLLLVSTSKAAPLAPPPTPTGPPTPPPPPPAPEIPPPTKIGDKVALTTVASHLLQLPDGPPVTDKEIPSNILVRVMEIGYRLPNKPGDWSRVLIPASIAWVLFDDERDYVGYVPSEVLGDPRAWTPAVPGTVGPTKI